jgi:SAM-dependent methyltransferase
MSTSARKAWSDLAQSFERGFWETLATRELAPSRGWLAAVSARIWQRFGFPLDAFEGRLVLDIGPGPTGRMLALAGEWLAIEPLAEAYAALPWAALDQYRRIYEQPAEERIEELVGACDVVLSINALDHCYDLNLVLRNAYAYLKPGGLLFVSFDVDKPVSHDPTHPICLTHERATEVIREEGFAIERIESGKASPTPDGWLDAWGGGTAWHWWAKRPCP